MRHEAAFARVRAARRRATVATATATAPFAGTWQNELGSKMTLSVNGSRVTGTYESAVSGAGGPVRGDVQGWVNEAVISVVVNWPSFGSITGWVGHHVVENQTEAIETLWQLTTSMQNPDDPSELWRSVFAGDDRFIRA